MEKSKKCLCFTSNQFETQIGCYFCRKQIGFRITEGKKWERDDIKESLSLKVCPKIMHGESWQKKVCDTERTKVWQIMAKWWFLSEKWKKNNCVRQLATCQFPVSSPLSPRSHDLPPATVDSVKLSFLLSFLSW